MSHLFIKRADIILKTKNITYFTSLTRRKISLFHVLQIPGSNYNKDRNAFHTRREYKSTSTTTSSSSSNNNDVNDKKKEAFPNSSSTVSSSTLLESSSQAQHANEIEKETTIDNVTSTSTSSFMKALPPSCLPYAQLCRFDKPIGTMLLLWPCYWSTSIAAAPLLSSSSANSQSVEIIRETIDIFQVTGDPKLLALFATGSFLMRGAGCTINDTWDANYDKKVFRTSMRPLACGALSYSQATAFLGLQLTGGLAVLTSLPHLEYCFWLGAASLPLIGVYPLMKRFTNWPQLVLGLTFNWGAFMGWAATHGSLPLHNGLSVVLPLYAGGVCWTLVYDTLYAHQDKVDDTKLGLKSTALHFGLKNTKPVLFGFSTLATGSWMLAGYNVGFTEPYYYIGCLAAGSHLFWQVGTADLNDAKNLADRFKSNNIVGGIMFASCIAGNIAMCAV